MVVYGKVRDGNDNWKRLGEFTQSSLISNMSPSLHGIDSLRKDPEIIIWWRTFKIIKYPMKWLKYLSKSFILGIDSIRKFT